MVDTNAHAQRTGELGAEIVEIGLIRCGRGFRRTGLRAKCGGDRLFGFSDGKLLFDDSTAKFDHSIRGGQGEKSTSVAHGNAFLDKGVFDFVGQIVEAKRVRNSGPFFSEAFGEIFLREVVLIE